MLPGATNLADANALIGTGPGRRKLGLDIPDTVPQWQDHHRTATFPGGIDLDLDSSSAGVCSVLQFAGHLHDFENVLAAASRGAGRRPARPAAVVNLSPT